MTPIMPNLRGPRPYKTVPILAHRIPRQHFEERISCSWSDAVGGERRYIFTKLLTALKDSKLDRPYLEGDQIICLVIRTDLFPAQSTWYVQGHWNVTTLTIIELIAGLDKAPHNVHIETGVFANNHWP